MVVIANHLLTETLQHDEDQVGLKPQTVGNETLRLGGAMDGGEVHLVVVEVMTFNKQMTGRAFCDGEGCVEQDGHVLRVGILRRSGHVDRPFLQPASGGDGGEDGKDKQADPLEGRPKVVVFKRLGLQPGT